MAESSLYHVPTRLMRQATTPKYVGHGGGRVNPPKLTKLQKAFTLFGTSEPSMFGRQSLWARTCLPGFRAVRCSVLVCRSKGLASVRMNSDGPTCSIRPQRKFVGFCSRHLLRASAHFIHVRQVTCSICQPFASSAWRMLSATRDSLTAKQRKLVGRDIAT